MKRGISAAFVIDKESFPTLYESQSGPISKPSASYSATLSGGIMHENFMEFSNPFWEEDIQDADLVDDTPMSDDDPVCPVILLTAEDKKRIRQPWRNSLIVKVFGRAVGFIYLRKTLSQKWKTEGDFSMVDIGNDYYVVKFRNNEDFNHVLIDGPWLIGENYLTIQRWRPNFVASEESIRNITAWIRIPNLSMEYFDALILTKIESKVGRVMKIDRTTSAAERGKFTRLSVELDINKPLLSKFWMNGRIWKIQYEGLRMICFKCGKIGHTLDQCSEDIGDCAEEPQVMQHVV